MRRASEPADRPPVRPRRRCCSRCSSPSPRAGPSSKPPRCAKTRSTARSYSSRSAIARGEILAADGTVLAAACCGEEGIYARTYPTGSLFAHTIGYYFTNLGSDRPRALPQRANSNGQTPQQPAVDPRPAPGHEAARRQGRHHARPGGPAGRPAGPRRPPRRGRGARTAQRRGQGDGLLARPMTRTPCASPTGYATARPATAKKDRSSTAPSSRLRAGLDLQGGHRDRRHRQRRATRPSRPQRAQRRRSISGMPLQQRR